MVKLSPMIRAALMVGDLDRARRFYEEVLGLREVYWQGRLAGASVGRLLGGPDDLACDAVILKAKGDAYGMVGLFQREDDIGTVDKPGPALRAGQACLVFYCDDLDIVTAKAPEYGGEILAMPEPLIHEGRIKQREMTLRDCEGFAINLIEWDPDRADRPEHAQGREPDSA